MCTRSRPLSRFRSTAGPSRCPSTSHTSGCGAIHASCNKLVDRRRDRWIRAVRRARLRGGRRHRLGLDDLRCHRHWRAVLTTVVVVVPPQPGRSVAPSPTITEIASAVLLLLKVPGEPNRGSRVSARLAARPASDQAGSISAAIEQLRGGLLSPSPRPRPRVDLDSRASALAHCLGQPNPGR